MNPKASGDDFGAFSAAGTLGAAWTAARTPWATPPMTFMPMPIDPGRAEARPFQTRKTSAIHELVDGGAGVTT